MWLFFCFLFPRYGCSSRFYPNKILIYHERGWNLSFRSPHSTLSFSDPRRSLEAGSHWSCCCGLAAKSCLTLRPHQPPLFMWLPRQEYWSGLPCPHWMYDTVILVKCKSLPFHFPFLLDGGRVSMGACGIQLRKGWVRNTARWMWSSLLADIVYSHFCAQLSCDEPTWYRKGTSFCLAASSDLMTQNLQGHMFYNDMTVSWVTWYQYVNIWEGVWWTKEHGSCGHLWKILIIRYEQY